MVGVSKSRRAAKAAGANADAEGAQSPRKWWQWLLLYPALGIALVTAAPQWIDKGRAWYNGTKLASYADAEKQNAMWRKNLSCSAVPFAWYANPNNVRVDATICDSGDVFVRASTPGNQQFFKWIGLDDVMNIQSGGGLIPGASAAPMSRATLSSGWQRPRMIAVQYTNAVVVCQKFLDQRRVLRHVRTGQGCFDEIIDTFNGTVLQRNAVPCRTQC